MAKLESGTKAQFKGQTITILGPADYEHYRENDPSQYYGDWRLAEFPDGFRGWVPTKSIMRLEGQTHASR